MKESKFVKARKVMKDTLMKDSELRGVYVANVACLLMDHIPSLKCNKDKRDDLALRIISLIVS